MSRILRPLPTPRGGLHDPRSTGAGSTLKTPVSVRNDPRSTGGAYRPR